MRAGDQPRIHLELPGASDDDNHITIESGPGNTAVGVHLPRGRTNA